jgi:hypothetical protein
MGFNELKTELEKSSVEDLLRAGDLIDQLMGDAKKSGFIEAFLGSEKTVYINTAKGKGNEWSKARIVGVNDDGISVKDWNDPDAKKKTVKWTSARTAGEHQKLAV